MSRFNRRSKGRYRCWLPIKVEYKNAGIIKPKYNNKLGVIDEYYNGDTLIAKDYWVKDSAKALEVLSEEQEYYVDHGCIYYNGATKLIRKLYTM